MYHVSLDLLGVCAHLKPANSVNVVFGAAFTLHFCLNKSMPCTPTCKPTYKYTQRARSYEKIILKNKHIHGRTQIHIEARRHHSHRTNAPPPPITKITKQEKDVRVLHGTLLRQLCAVLQREQSSPTLLLNPAPLRHLCCCHRCRRHGSLAACCANPPWQLALRRAFQGRAASLGGLQYATSSELRTSA